MGIVRTVLRGVVDQVAGEQKDVPPPAASERKQAEQPRDVEKATNEKQPGWYGDGGYDRDEPDRRKAGGRKKPPKKFLLVLNMLTQKEWRWAHSLRSTVLWGITMIIIGIVFLCLSATGTYPTTVTNMKYVNIFAETLVKYSLYIFAGLLAMVSVFFARVQLRSDKSTILPRLGLLIAPLIAIATIGMSIYISVKVSSISSQWYEWLILVLIIIQRICFAIACFCALATLVDAESNPDVKSIIE